MTPRPALSVLCDRRRSFKGDGACAIGGVGSWACDDVGGVTGSSAMGAGDASKAWRERQVVKMFPIAFWVESWGGLAGGEAR